MVMKVFSERGPRPLFLRPISRGPEDSDSSSDEDDEEGVFFSSPF